MLIQLAALLVSAALAAAQTPECNPLADMSGCQSPERCREVFVESDIGEKIARINASCHSMLDLAENRSRDAKMQAAVTNKELWKRVQELFPQLCRLRQNATRMQQEARAVLDKGGATEDVRAACEAVLDFPAGLFDAVTETVLDCFRNSTMELMESALRLEEELISGSMQRIEQTAQLLEDCIPEVTTCDLPEDEVAAMVECVSQKEADGSLDQREKDLGVFATRLVTLAGANYTMLTMRMHRCFGDNLHRHENVTDAFMDDHGECIGSPRIKDEL